MAAVGPAGDAFALAPEADRPCPSCKAMIPADAAHCRACGVELRPEQKPNAPSRSAEPRRKPAERTANVDDVPALLKEADEAVAGAREELDSPLPLFAGSDWATVVMRASSGILNPSNRFDASGDAAIVKSYSHRCANPACDQVPRMVETGPDGEMRMGTPPVKVSGSFRGKSFTMYLCATCAGKYEAQRRAQQRRLLKLLQGVYEDLRQAAKQHPGQEAKVRKRIGAIEKLAAEAGVRLRSGCFIATAAFGSPRAEQVHVLRRFRDEVLLSRRAGRWFVAGYYHLSPPLAAGLRRTRAGRAVVRWLLRPVVALCRRTLGQPQSPGG
jgi:hypothetical protein